MAYQSAAGLVMTVADDARKPSVFFVGVGKCGTSWLWSHLGQSAKVVVPTVKEPYLIDLPASDQQAAVERWWPKGDGPLADFSNVYYWDVDNPSKVHSYNPDARIVLTVRRPSERAVSHFRFLHRNGLVGSDDLADYLTRKDGHELVARSDYIPMLERYESMFGPNRVLVLPLELLQHDATAYLKRLGEFLGIEFEPVSEADAEPVLSAAAPRNRHVSRVAYQTGVILRRAGLLRVLSSMKQSPLVARILFTEAGSADHLKAAAAALPALHSLDSAYPDLLRRVGLDPSSLGL